MASRFARLSTGPTGHYLRAEVMTGTHRSWSKLVRRLAALVAGLLTMTFGLIAVSPAYADTQSFSNTTSIAIPGQNPLEDNQPGAPYPSNISVSGMSGPVSGVSVTFHGLTHVVGNDIDALLVAPSGESLIVMSDLAGSASFVSFNNADITLSDGGAAFPTSGTVSSDTYRPTNIADGSDSFPAPAPAPSSATTFAEAFTGITANGTWSLYVVDDTDGDTGTMAGGWSLSIETTVAGVATSTSVASSANPSTTGDEVDFVATVTSEGDPVTDGTVTFTADGTPIGSPADLDSNGKATVSTSGLAEGSHIIRATFDGATGFLSSNDDLTQVVDNATTSSGTTFCNTGAITVSDHGAGTPYPSHITVSGLDGTIASVTATLKGLQHSSPIDFDILLAGPDLAHNVVLMSDVGGTSPINLDQVTFDDSADPISGALTAGTFQPTDDDTDGDDSFAAPAPTPESDSALSTFAGASPNGTWSLYVLDDATADSGSISGGWCLDFELTQATTTTVVADPASAEFGQPVSLTATVSTADGTADSGDVTFSIDGTAVGSPVSVDSSGVATLSTADLSGDPLAVGTHTVSAHYAGSGAFTASTSTDTSFSVTPAGTDTALSAAPSSPEVGTDTVITATVTSHGDKVTDGTVTFEVPGQPDSTVDLDADGTADLTLTPSTADSVAIGATYNGTASYLTSDDSLDLDVQRVTTTTVVSSDGSPSTFGNTVTLTAVVTAGGNPAQSGTVQFKDGDDVLGTVAVDGSGTADLGVSSLSVGSHSITAAFSGNDTQAPSADSLTQQVTKANSSMTLTSSANPSIFGQSVTFTAQVSGVLPDAVSGQVDFIVDGGTPVTVSLDTSGQATFTTSDLSASTHVITALFSGNESYQTSSAAPLLQLIIAAPTVTLLDANPSSSVLGDSVTFTATVTSGIDQAAGGDVEFFDGTDSLGTASLGSNGTAELSIDALTVGSHSITATYSGTSSYMGSTSTAVAVEVTKIPTVVALTAIPDSPQVGDTVVVTATVTADGNPVTDGAVVFSIDGSVVQDATNVAADGTVTFTTTVPSVGSRTITADYQGTDTYAASADDLIQTAGKGTSDTALTSSAASPSYGDSITFTATVSGIVGPMTDGTVTFSLDGETQGSPVALDGDGKATWTTSDIPAGTHTVAAAFSGNDNYAESNTSIQQSVSARATTLNATTDPTGPSQDGQDVTVQASVAAVGSDQPVSGGSVQLSVDGTAGDPVPVDAQGNATLSTGALGSGTHTLHLDYLPDANHLASSTEILLDVDPVAAAGGPYQITEGEALALDGSGSTADADLAWDVNGDGDFSDASGATATLDWAQLEDLGISDGPSTYTVTLRATKNGHITTSSAQLTVTNAPPKTIIDGPSTATVGEPFTLKISADDPSSADAAAMFTYLVDWGDGSPQETITGPADPPVTHVYTSAGSITASFTAVDRDGDGGGAATLTVTVNPASTSTSPSATPSSGGQSGSGGQTIANTGSDVGIGALAVMLAMIIGGAVLIRRRSLHRQP